MGSRTGSGGERRDVHSAAPAGDLGKPCIPAARDRCTGWALREAEPLLAAIQAGPCANAAPRGARQAHRALRPSSTMRRRGDSWLLKDGIRNT
eukprot:6193832-Pleurochrysis_carterae.AAC.2